MNWRDARIFVAGHAGLVGSALLRRLQSESVGHVITRSRSELDLRDQLKVRQFFDDAKPEVVFLAAARVGGIHANNTQRWEFLYDNLLIESNVLGCSLDHDVRTLVFLGSSCIYPRDAQQPIREDYLLTGPLERTNEPYAIAKIAGLKLVEAANEQRGRQWLSLMPTNLYGPGDNFDLESSHVLPALIRKFHDARLEAAINPSVRLWGTGTPLREFLHVDDLAAAACALVDGDKTGLYNVGSGEEISIRDLATLIAEIIGFKGGVEWDASRPDGTPRKLLDSTKLGATGWVPTIKLRDGIRSTYEWFQASHLRLV